MTVAEKKNLDKIKSDFLESTGYSEDDILAFNPNSLNIVTRNGGRYHITQTRKIIHLTGPSPDPTERN